MNPMSFRRIALGASLACALAVGSPALLRGAEIIEQVLVKVNGEILTKSDLEERQVAALRAQNRNIRPEDAKDETLQKMLAEVTPTVIADAIDELLILQRGKELGFALSDEQFGQIVANIRKENRLESEEQFLAALKSEGLSLPDLRRSIERQMIVNRVQQQDVMDKISVTEAESAAYFAAHKDEFTTPAAVTLREILVAVPERAPEGTANAGQEGLNVGLDEEAKVKAEALRHRITAGDDVATLAAASSDAPSKANGGLIGPVNPEEMSPQLMQVVKSLKVGETSQPIRTQRGYQIIKLESRNQVVVPTLEQVRNQVADRVFREKGRPELTKYLKRLRDQAIIEWKNDEIRKVYEAHQAKPAAPAAAAPSTSSSN
jgi:parvulin-like peptidyl-prolyl isomerase